MKRERIVLSRATCASLSAFLILLCALFSIARAQQTNDANYTAKIKEYTTDPMFSTELTDHLPASDTVPTPEKFLGYVIGAPNKLTYSKDIYAYFRALERATPRVRVFTAPERTEEGREQILVAISDEANLSNLERLKEINARLADPRKTSEAEARQLISEAKAFYWLSGSIHSPETGSPEMLMELAYRLAVEDTPLVKSIRRDCVVLMTPALEVDGHDFMVDLYNYHRANLNKPAPPLLYWGKYVAHDNNRDGLGMALALTRNQMRTFLEYHPVILHDLHESVPFLYTSTGTGPYNAWLDPIVIDEWQELAYHEIEEMTKRGVPGVWTHGFYDGWAPNYMFYVANGHNAIGRFYETFGNGGADTLERTVGGGQTQREWFRPNPPLPRVKWSMRNNINMQQSALLLAMSYTAANREKFLNNFYLKSRRSIAKATNEGPAAYIIPADDPRPVEVADAVNLLRLMGVEVQQMTKEFSIKDQKFPANSYVIRMDQPYSRMADMLLDTQYYNANDPRPYDDTGWTLGAMRNIKTVRVTDRAILSAPMNLLTTDARVVGKIAGERNASIFIINHNTDNTLAALPYRLNGAKIAAAEEAFKIGNQNFKAGSFVITGDANLRAQLEAAANELGLNIFGVAQMPEVKTHELAAPRIAILHTWTNTQNEGWYRIEFDRLKIPYTYISDHTVRDTPDLRAKFDVIIFPPVGNTAQSIVNGVPKIGDKIPWQSSTVTPNFATSPDQTDDIRGGMELVGVEHLRKFIEDGGLFIAIGNVARVPIDYGITSNVSVEETRTLQARGSIYNATFVDRKSPIAYGYGENLAIYFNQSPVFQVAPPPSAAAFAGGGGGGASGGRPSGRGTLNDPDIVQAMPQPSATPPQDGRRDGQRRETAGGEGQITEEMRQFLGPYLIPREMRPRVVMRFARDEKNLLVSGMLAGGSELANHPAIVDCPVGKGHVVMFATNPMWRHQTQGEFFLIFNAALNFNNLNVGLNAPPAARAPTQTGDDEN